MKNLLLLSTVLFAILLSTSCKKEETQEQPANELKAVLEYDEGGQKYSIPSPVAEWHGDFLKVGTYARKLSLFLEDCKEGTYELNQNSFSEAFYYPYPNEKRFSSNLYEETSGSITVTDYNREDSLISGTFEFRATYPYDQNDKREITNGVFENLKIERVEPFALEGRISTMIDGKAFKFRDVYIHHHNNSITAIATHPSGPVINILIPRNSTEGTYDIPESELGPTDVVGILYQHNCNALFHNSPTTESQMILKKVDFHNRSIEGELSVTLSDNNEGIVAIENLTFKLDWFEPQIGK